MMAPTHTPLHISPVPEPMVPPDWGTICRTFQRLATPLDAVHILRSCVPELSTGPFLIKGCVILDAKLKTYLKPTSKHKSTLSVCYQLTLRENPTSPSCERIFYIKAFLGGHGKETFRTLVQNRMSALESYDSVIHVPKHDLILWRFPHDPGLPHLRQLVNLLAIERYLPVDGLRQIGLQGTPQVLMRQLVQYRPEIRCTHRYDLCDPTTDQTAQLFAKTFAEVDGQAVYDRLQYFWDRSLADLEAMAIAQPLGYSAAINTVWQRSVPGTPLRQVLDTSNYRQYIAAVAQGLASLHTSQIEGLATHSPHDHLVEIRKKLAKLSDALPQLSKIFDVVGDNMEQTAPPRSAIPFNPIHWDFHIDQLLADQGKLVFCDMDELIIGDPLQDLANFIVDLHVRLANPSFVRLITAELCHHYGKLVQWEVQPERLTWHIRLQLVNKAYRQYLRLAPGFENIVEGMMRLAQRGLPL